MEADFQNEVLSMLQCSICLDTLENPKGLMCQHTFCKTCLDDVLEFRKDGGALIVCPFKCERNTFIPAHQTTEDLPAPYQLKGILELHCKQTGANSTPVVAQCKGESCPFPPSVCCTKCFQSFCTICKESHVVCTSVLPLSVKGFVPIRYNKSVSKYMPMCVDHSSIANFVCDCSANKFICIYCKERDHSKHKVSDIRQKAAIIKEKLQGGQLQTILNNAYSIIKQKETIIPECRNLLMHTLWNRKVEELVRFIALLNDEEVRLMKRFDILSSAHLWNYNEKDMASVEQFVDKISNNEDFQVILNENYVTDIHDKYSKITAVKLKLDDKGNEKCPLGDLSIEYNFKFIEASKSINRFTHNFTINPDVREKVETLIKNLNELLPEVQLPKKPKVMIDLTRNVGSTDDKGKRKCGKVCERLLRGKGERPLTGKRVYLDIANDKKVEKLKQKVKLLGGEVEEFLSKEISLILTSQKICDAKESSKSADLSELDDDALPKVDLSKRPDIADKARKLGTDLATVEEFLDELSYLEGEIFKDDLDVSRGKYKRKSMPSLPSSSSSSTAYNSDLELSQNGQLSVLTRLDDEGLSYIDTLIKDNQVEVLKFLLSSRPELVKLKENFSSPLSSAVKYNNLAIYKLLTDHGARVASEDEPSSCKRQKLDETRIKQEDES